MERKTNFVALLLTIAAISGCGGMERENAQIHLHISAPKTNFVNVPVQTRIELPEQFNEVAVDKISVVLKEQGKDGAGVPGQIVMDPENEAQLWWIVPKAKANSASNWVATLSRRKKDNQVVFRWNETPADYLDLLFNGRKVMRYMYAYDNSTQERFLQTYKPFHHVFDAQGENLLTKGPGGLYTHHRGIFIGWNKLEFGGEEYDFWGMREGAQQHQKFLQKTAGAVLAKSKSVIHWILKNGKPVIVEEREVTVFRQPAPTILLLDFHTQLNAVNGDVFLNGDPEHGGLQFRAHNEVSKGSERAQDRDMEGYEDVKARYLFHKDSIDPHEDKDLPWAAMCFGLDNRHYSVQHMNHPDNPKPTFYSAYRDYGRFGSFFKQKISASETLTLSYRIWVVEDEKRAREKLESHYLAFVDGLKVEVLN